MLSSTTPELISLTCQTVPVLTTCVSSLVATDVSPLNSQPGYFSIDSTGNIGANGWISNIFSYYPAGSNTASFTLNFGIAEFGGAVLNVGNDWYVGSAGYPTGLVWHLTPNGAGGFYTSQWNVWGSSDIPRAIAWQASTSTLFVSSSTSIYKMQSGTETGTFATGFSSISSMAVRGRRASSMTVNVTTLLLFCSLTQTPAFRM
jgi:hypothetical protein